MTADKLAAIQGALKAPKSQYNSFGKYSYRSCEDILEAVKPLLKEQQAAVILSDDIVHIGDRYYVKATAIFKDNDGEISVTAYAREDDSKKGMDGAQLTGSTSSYARKYALNGLFAIDDTKDSDGTNNGENAPKTGGKAPTGKQSSQTQTSENDGKNAFEYALNFEVTVKGKKYKLKDLNDKQLEWLEGQADEELKKLINKVFASRMADEEPPFGYDEGQD